jgi:hypothetical protein
MVRERIHQGSGAAYVSLPPQPGQKRAPGSMEPPQCAQNFGPARAGIGADGAPH